MSTKHTVFFLSILCFSITNLIQAQNWTQFFPIGSAPTSRFWHSAIYDEANNRMTIYGGYSGLYLSDVWVLSNANGLNGTPVWTQLTTIGSNTVGQVGHSAIYDGTSNRMTIYPSVGGVGVNVLWILTNANGLGGSPTWITMTTAGISTTAGSSPDPLLYNTTVYDTANNRTILFGGSSDGFYGKNDVWVLSNANGLDGIPTWTRVSTTGNSPPPRFNHAAVYDAMNNRLITFGGQSSLANDMNDVWVLSHANGLGGSPAWSQLFPTGSAPTTRDSHTAIYDAIHNRMIVFGGYFYNHGSDSIYLNDIWVLTNANGLGGTPAWVQVSPNGTPPTIRYGQSAVHDSVNHRMIIFGGYDFDAGFYHYKNDIWVLNNLNNLFTDVSKDVWELLDK